MSVEGPIEDYSAGYYAVEMRVAPYEDGPMIDRHMHDYIENDLYANTDAPVWMRASFQPSPYFQVNGDELMPTDIIGLPKEWMRDLDLEDDNEYHTFYLCKPGTAHFVSQSVMLGSVFTDSESNE